MNKNLTEIAYILDRSGSMAGLSEAAITGFNTFLKEQNDTPGDATLSLVLFDDEYLLHADRSPIQNVPQLDAETYTPRGCTALLDAIGRTIDNIGKKLAQTPEKQRPAQVIIAIYTDGYENASSDYSVKKINQMIRHQTDQYGWEFLFLAANQDAIATATSYGIHQANSSVVSADEAGTLATSASYSRKVKASRKLSQGCADEQDIKDSSASLSEIVEEETQKQKK
ncbi:MAG: vWA domain-containing protein [Akkermansiaceae bacterium]